MSAVFGRFLAHGYLPHFLTVAGFLLAFFMVARLIGEKRAPANTFAWLLGIILIPYVGVPLYLIFGGRKLRRLAGRKAPVVPTLKRPRPHPPQPPAAPAVADTVVSAGGCPPVDGNRFRLLATGEEDFLALEKHIREARHSIHITTFILGRDETARRLVDLLAQRARDGVKVRLLLDALGCLVSSTYFVNPLRKAGGEVGRFMPVLPFGSRTSANLRIHRKIAVFDHNTAMIGGRNLARDYMGPLPYRRRWRDLGAVIEGPAAALLNQVFIADWCFATRQEEAKLRAEIPEQAAQPVGPSELQVVASGPDVPGDPLYEGIIAMIQEAEKSILIVTPYFIPDEVLLRSLMVKARAGRDVVLVLPARSNHPLTDFARRYYTRELVRAGARVMLYGEHMLHAKAVIVDDRVALIGSANFDLRSLFVNFEIGVFAHSEPDVRALREWARGLMQQCRKATPSADRRRGLLGNLAEDLSRLLAPLL
ncbi:MAG TPA: phospholipase D-like domain-containing protein [Opitutaceae bacterium]|nr:phospholipase D-like domain-containing protein [Opitutaceae bacterium]